MNNLKKVCIQVKENNMQYEIFYPDVLNIVTSIPTVQYYYYNSTI